MSALHQVTANSFRDEVIQAEIPVLVDFYAPWCGPCRMLSPLLEKLAGDLAGHVKFVKVNVDDEPELAQIFQIQSIPTLITFRYGQVVDMLIGIGSPGDLQRALVRLTGSEPQTRPSVPVR